MKGQQLHEWLCVKDGSLTVCEDDLPSLLAQLLRLQVELSSDRILSAHEVGIKEVRVQDLQIDERIATVKHSDDRQIVRL